MTSQLKFDVQRFYHRAKKLKDKLKVDGVTISLPFISFNFSADNKEKEVAKEIVLRLRDKRVLNSKECCENCIDNSLKSIIQVRELLVDKQVQIGKMDSILFLLMDFALYGIKRFLTYTESFDPTHHKQEYFEALHIIRGHLLRTLDQIAKIANMQIEYGFRNGYIETWQKEVYNLTTPGKPPYFP